MTSKLTKTTLELIARMKHMATYSEKQIFTWLRSESRSSNIFEVKFLWSIWRAEARTQNSWGRVILADPLFMPIHGTEVPIIAASCILCVLVSLLFQPPRSVHGEVDCAGYLAQLLEMLRSWVNTICNESPRKTHQPYAVAGMISVTPWCTTRLWLGSTSPREIRITRALDDFTGERTLVAYRSLLWDASASSSGRLVDGKVPKVDHEGAYGMRGGSEEEAKKEEKEARGEKKEAEKAKEGGEEKKRHTNNKWGLGQGFESDS
ncbi:hypothetical protein ABW19_dt0205093 [Dactylella cylindrospora]|nr:hypothetical protein ABW19_dt0205093 [Dactylella cylindrospora]